MARVLHTPSVEAGFPMASQVSLRRKRAVALNISAALLSGCLLPFALSAPQEAPLKAGHPYIEQNDIKAETCLRCHPHEQEGRFVHSAMVSGCDNCHHVTSEKETQQTTITLAAAGGDLCAMCHEASKDPVVHGPVKAGQCLACHDPHGSEFKAHTRADGNALCLGCHAPQRISGETVTVFKTVSMSRQDFQAIPKIELDATRRVGHPSANHPVADFPNPLNPKEKMSCLSCHKPHSSSQQSLIIPSPKGKDLCDTCHQAFDEQKKGKVGKLNQKQIESAGQAAEDNAQPKARLEQNY
jgi:predicted CXXCH cytochrome family protein